MDDSQKLNRVLEILEFHLGSAPRSHRDPTAQADFEDVNASAATPRLAGIERAEGHSWQNFGMPSVVYYRSVDGKHLCKYTLQEIS